MKSLFCYLTLGLTVFTLSSCQKEEIKETTIEQGQKIWYKDKVYTVKTTLDEKGQFTTAYMPTELKAFYEDSTKATVTHVLNTEKGLFVCLYDTEDEFRAHVSFESSETPNRPKSYNGATIKTYSGGGSYEVIIGYNPDGSPRYIYADYTSGTLLRTSTNSTLGTWHLGTNEGYAYSLPWVGNTENDNIESIEFNRLLNSEATQFMGCKHINWGGGSKLWVTNNVATSWPLNLNRQGWGNCISSYEYFQADVAIHGINF